MHFLLLSGVPTEKQQIIGSPTLLNPKIEKEVPKRINEVSVLQDDC